MKHLNIKWLPETVANVSLTIAKAQESQHEAADSSRIPMPLASLARMKVIVISGRHELKAAVSTTAAALALA